MNRVSLTQDEFDWIARNVPKMITRLEQRAEKEPDVLKRKTYKLLTSVKESLDTAGGAGLTDLMLGRQQKLVLRELISQVTKVLKDAVIPTYEKRGESHKEYLDKAKEKAENLDRMARKFK